MKYKLISLSLLFGLLLVPGGEVFADYGLQATADSAGLTNAAGGTDIPTILGNIIGTALSLVSILFFILMIYGGFLWMTAHGKSEQTTKALDTIIAAVIGIVIVMGAYALTNFVFNDVVGGGGGTVTPGAGAGSGRGGALQPIGGSCTNDGQCQSGYCNSGPQSDGSVSGSCEAGAGGAGAADAGAGAADAGALQRVNLELITILRITEGFSACIDDGFLQPVDCDEPGDFSEIGQIRVLVEQAQGLSDLALKQTKKDEAQAKLDQLGVSMRRCDQEIITCARAVR